MCRTGRRNKETKPGRFKHQLRPKMARKVQKRLPARSRRWHHARGATSKVASTPVYAAEALSKRFFSDDGAMNALFFSVVP